MWPNELALLIIETLNITSDDGKGITVIFTITFYLICVVLISGVLSGLVERRK